MSDLKISISGVRGVVSESLTPRVVVDLVSAFGTYVLKKDRSKKKIKVAIGMDSRLSGDMMSQLIISALRACGIHVLDLGLIPTPTVLFIVREQGLAGGLIVTASHNPKEWNGLKFVSSRGTFLRQNEWDEVYNIYKTKEFKYGSYRHLGEVYSYHEAANEHIQKVLSFIQTEKIKEKKFKVAYDPCNGAGSHITKVLLERLGCEVFSIHADSNKEFERSPEPIPSNIKKLEKYVLEKSCDIGFAIDPDADRVAIVSEKGQAIGEEYTLAIALDHYLKVFNPKTSLAVNVSTSRMIDDTAEKYGVRLHRTAVGEINVVDVMLKERCEIGGEGNGGVIIPEINSGRDSLVAMAMVLSAMTSENMSLSAMIQRFKAYHFLKDRVETGKLNTKMIYDAMMDKYKDHSISTLDGVKVDFDHYWLQIRESNTEPIIRIFVEAESESLAKEKIEEFKGWIRNIGK